MKTNIKTVAAYAAAAIWADGFYDETEKAILSDIAEVYAFNKEELTVAVETEISRMENLSEVQVNETLQELGSKVETEEKGILFECVLEIVLADSKLTLKEVASLMAIADILGMKEEEAVLLLADMIKNEPEIEVEC